MTDPTKPNPKTPIIPKVGDTASVTGTVIQINNYEFDTKAVVQFSNGQMAEISIQNLENVTSPVRAVVKEQIKETHIEDAKKEAIQKEHIKDNLEKIVPQPKESEKPTP